VSGVEVDGGGDVVDHVADVDGVGESDSAKPEARDYWIRAIGL